MPDVPAGATRSELLRFIEEARSERDAAQADTRRAIEERDRALKEARFERSERERAVAARRDSSAVAESVHRRDVRELNAARIEVEKLGRALCAIRGFCVGCGARVPHRIGEGRCERCEIVASVTGRAAHA